MSAVWKTVRLAEVLTRVERPEAPMAGTTYRQLGVKLWGQGAYEREAIDGADTRYATLSRVAANDVVVNKIWARNGSVAVVQSPLAGCFVSGEFPTFTVETHSLFSSWRADSAARVGNCFRLMLCLLEPELCVSTPGF